LQLAVQIRILREIKTQQGAPNAAQAQPIQMEFTSPPPYSNDLASSASSLGQSPPSDPYAVLPQIVSHHQERFIQDYHFDAADLKRVIQQALSSGSDAQLVEVWVVRYIKREASVDDISKRPFKFNVLTLRKL